MDGYENCSHKYMYVVEVGNTGLKVCEKCGLWKQSQYKVDEWVGARWETKFGWRPGVRQRTLHHQICRQFNQEPFHDKEVWQRYPYKSTT